MARVQINHEQVTHALIEGEVVALNLRTGSYFSMVKVAADAWGVLAASPSSDVDEIALALGRVYRDCPPPAQARAEIERFLADLAREALIVPAPAGASPAPSSSQPSTVAPADGSAPAWVTPALEIYDDLKDLLLLDPIHDVDESGWPSK